MNVFFFPLPLSPPSVNNAEMHSVRMSRTTHPNMQYNQKPSQPSSKSSCLTETQTMNVHNVFLFVCPASFQSQIAQVQIFLP